MKYIVAIDQGTTGSRAIAYDRRGRKAASAYQEFPQYFPRPGWVEHDPKEIWHSVNTTLQKVFRTLPKGSVEAIGITNQRETTVIWDRASGRPVHNAIVWQCRRTAGRCEQIKADKKGQELIRKRTGLPVDAYFSATKIEWILRNVPGAAKKAREGKLAFGTTDSWVLNRLTGGRVHATDYTNASRTMLFNIDALRWDADILTIFSIPASILPSVHPSSGTFGTTVKDGFIPAGIPITGIAGDQQAALFGQACFEPGTMKNTYGTGAFMLMNTGSKRPYSRYGLITTLACGASGPVYCLEGSIFIAGSAIQWLRDGLQIIGSAAESQKLARSIPDTAGVYFVPALVGLGAPYWNSACRGAIYGITRGTGRAHLVRAALEAMCYQTRDVFDAMRKDSGLSPEELRVDGGASANDFLCSFQAGILGVKVIRPRVIETTSLGAAYLAGLAAGYWKSVKEIKDNWMVDRSFVPSMPKARSRALYEGWKQAVRRTIA
ncbi:MAG: glycerol kinase GlpK [Deltaproteobacteria bacterium]